MIDLLSEFGLARTWATVIALVVIVVVAVAAVWVVRIGLDHVGRRLLEGRAGEPDAGLPQVEIERRVRTLQQVVTRVVVATIAIIAVLTALSLFHVDIGPAIAGLGVVGIAVGLGAQTLVRDWLAGIFIILENQYNEGDVVRVAGVSGVVEGLSLRRTVLRDLDGSVHTVPNGQIVVATNMTRVWARVNLDVQVAYDTDIERATAVINEIGAAMHADPEWGPRLLEAPSVVRVGALGELGPTLKVLGQVRAAEQWSVAGELRKRILAAFAERGIRMPSSQRIVVSGPEPPRTDLTGPAGTP